MHEAECLGMESLTRTEFEAVLDKRLVVFYTYQDGHPVLLIDSMERARCYICDDNTLVIDGANSAFNTEYSCYSYANGTLTEIEPVESAYQQLDYTPFSQYGA